MNAEHEQLIDWVDTLVGACRVIPQHRDRLVASVRRVLVSAACEGTVYDHVSVARADDGIEVKLANRAGRVDTLLMVA